MRVPAGEEERGGDDVVDCPGVFKFGAELVDFVWFSSGWLHKITIVRVFFPRPGYEVR